MSTPEPTTKCVSRNGATRILVVDDNPPSALSLSWAMELYGYHVRTCYDGRTALQEADGFSPDVVLLDIGMPVMNGLETCAHLRANPVHRGMVVIAQTGWGDREMRERTGEAGFDHHLVKPIDLDGLLALLPPARH